MMPARSVTERDGRQLDFAVKDGRAQWAYLTLGRSNGIETEVRPDSVTGLIPQDGGAGDRRGPSDANARRASPSHEQRRSRNEPE
jgi:hypothetical protein